MIDKDKLEYLFAYFFPFTREKYIGKMLGRLLGLLHSLEEFVDCTGYKPEIKKISKRNIGIIQDWILSQSLEEEVRNAYEETLLFQNDILEYTIKAPVTNWVIRHIAYSAFIETTLEDVFKCSYRMRRLLPKYVMEEEYIIAESCLETLEISLKRAK